MQEVVFDTNKQYFAYKIINYVLLLIFSLAFLWFLLMKNKQADFPVCQIKKITGKECATCGITRDFISFTNFTGTSKPQNAKSVYYFAFFIFAGFSRFFISILCFFNKINKKILITDIVFSSITFLTLIVSVYAFNI